MLFYNEKRNLPPPRSLQIIKQEDKSFGRLLSKEQNIENINHQRGESSFRVMYYGGATGSIPFHWESRPGTPKHALFSDTSSLPPLTPPPSYQQSPKTNSSISQQKGDITSFSSSKSKLFHTILPKFAKSSRKINIIPISSSTYSGSSSGSNSSSSYSFTSRKNSAPRSRSPIYFGLEDDDDDDDDDEHQEELTRSSTRRHRRRRTVTLCFGSGNNGGACRRSRAGRHLEVKSLRKGFLSIFATHGTA